LATESVKEPKKGKRAAEKAKVAEAGKKQRNFEMVLVINPEADGEKFDSILNNVNRLITGLGGEVSEVEQWGKRKLAYPIKGLTEGNYVLTHFKIEPFRNRELEAKLKISEDVARHLLIRLGS
jgi:small subunit ribosomal protein S6